MRRAATVTLPRRVLDALSVVAADELAVALHADRIDGLNTAPGRGHHVLGAHLRRIIAT